jgi:pimeloyl-ACP methyl ester carboxylesterase
MARPILRCALWLLQLGIVFGTFGHAADTPQQHDATDAEYQKLDAAASFVRRRNAESYAVTSAAGIDEASYVSIGGIEQWVTIRGRHRENPVLLFLHGGPGDVTNPWAFALFAPWQEQFTIVQWDQRGAGRTLRRTGPSIAPTMTLDRIVNDGIALAEYLRTHLGKDKIIVVGHSFGSIIGLRMARARPDLFFAYVGTGQVADGPSNYTVAYDALVAKARSLGNPQALDELTRIGRPPYASGRGYAVQRKWANAFEGADQFLYGAIGLALVAPGNSVRDINDWFDGQQLSGERLVAQTAALGPKDLGLDFAIPIFVFQGAEDFTTPTALSRRYLASVKARRKAFVSIEGGGHFAVFMKSDRFLKELTRRVRPLAVTR